MKLGEIKAEALKIMFADYAGDISAENLENLGHDENYGKYLAAMPGAINRAYSRLEDCLVVPVKTFDLSMEAGVARGEKIVFDLGALISDFGAVDRVIAWGDYHYNSNADYIMETSTTIAIPNNGKNFTIVYHPLLTRITVGTKDDQEIELPDKIACLIPYFIKGDLFREDEPAEASEARNLFEASIAEISDGLTQRQTQVKAVYSLMEV